MREQIFIQAFWQWRFLGNTLEQYAIALIVFGFLYLGLRLVRSVVFHQLRRVANKTNIRFFRLLVDGLYKLHPLFLSFIAFYGSLSLLQLPGLITGTLDWILTIWIGFQTVQILQGAIDAVMEKSSKDEKEEDTEGHTALLHLAQIAKLVLWVVAILVILANRGVEITSLVAGLGIGGLAIAFAVQNILSDLFGSFAIYFDKPFSKGDFIVVGENAGTVEKVGIKTTRIRALQGEEIIISNKELTSARIQNFKRMTRRRIAFTFGVVYESKSAALRKIPKLVEKIIKDMENVDFDRAHFRTFGESALQFEVVYFVNKADFVSFVDAQQEINFQLKEALEKNNTPMAYPTQTVYIRK